MLVKYKFLKKNDTAKRKHLNTLLDTMIMTLLDHYVQDFHKCQAMLKNLIKMQQCLLELIINRF